MSGALGMRMLNACACGRQYDVSHRIPGDRVLCECGISFRVEFRQPHSPRALRCSSCGANLRVDGKACDYCAAEITLEERRLASVCPGCFARAAVDARFCMECGLKIEPQALAALPQRAVCPRCKGGMRQRALGTASVAECASCGGLWLAQDHFDRLCEAADEAELASRGLMNMAEPPKPANADELRYLMCVECGDLMNRRNYASSSGIIFDVCRHHGVWLDHTELEKILGFVRNGGLDRARERQIERLKDQERRTRLAGMGEAFGRSMPVEQNPELSIDLVDWVATLVDWFRK